MSLPIYYGSHETLSHKETFHLKKYLKRTPFHTFQHFLLDPAILTPANLDCMNCKLVHPVSCCEEGQPFSMTKQQEQVLESHAIPIIKRYLTNVHLHEATTNGFLEQVSSQADVQNIKKCQGNCFFLAGNLCSIHQYAEHEEIEADELKPFSCSLFPLDIIQYQQSIIITSLTHKTASFSRWGEEYKDYICINRSLRQRLPFQVDQLTELENVPFRVEDYKPAWSWNQELLQKHFGNELILFIESLCS